MLNFRESKAKVLELKSPMYDIYSPTCLKFIFMVDVGEYTYNTWILWGYDSPSRKVVQKSLEPSILALQSYCKLALLTSTMFVSNKKQRDEILRCHIPSHGFSSLSNFQNVQKITLSSCVVLPHSKGLNIHRQLEEKSFYQPR